MYRGRGYDFTITSSTAYDQKWIYGRNVFEEIDYLVDSIFTNYLSRPGVRQPIFTSYCDGNRTTCRGLSQWGSKSLADQGYSAIDIIHYYYGNDMYINSADIISGVPSSWPGYDLTIGSSGEKSPSAATAVEPDRQKLSGDSYVDTRRNLWLRYCGGCPDVPEDI